MSIREDAESPTGAWAALETASASFWTGVSGATKMSRSEHEQPIDLWAEQRGEVAVLVGQLQPGVALEILRRVVTECTEGHQVVPMLLGTIRGVVERRGRQAHDG